MEEGCPKSCVGFKKCHLIFQLFLPGSGVLPSERKMKGPLKISIDISSFLNPLTEKNFLIEMHVCSNFDDLPMSYLFLKVGCKHVTILYLLRFLLCSDAV